MPWPFNRRYERPSDTADRATGQGTVPPRQGPPTAFDTDATYSDDPLTEVADDVLDRGRLAVQIARVLQAVSRQTDSAVVALVGPWGSGKTTLLHAVERELSNRGDWHLARYNPWSYSTLDSAVIGFFAELRGALPEDALGTDRRGAVGRFGARLAPLGAVGGWVGIDATAALREVFNLVAGDQSPERLRERAAKELESLAAPVLIVLDDLDRLEPAELLVTFKLVRLLGRLPNVYYLLSYDEATLEAVLGRTDLVGSGKGRARDYLEKMVQVRLDIPPLLAAQQVTLLNQGLDASLTRHGIELGQDAKVRLQEAWTYCLCKYLMQPRSIKKLLAQVDALWGEVAGEVDFVDFFLMTFLRTFERAAFELVIRERAELVGRPSLDYLTRDKESHKDRWKRWTESLKHEDVRHPEPVAILLSELFLPLRSARQNMSYGSHYSADIASRRGVGSDEFFDRYTQFGVPATDVSERAVAAAVSELRDGTTGSAVRALEERIPDDAMLVLGKLHRINELQGLPGASTLALLARNYAVAMRQESGSFGMSPDFHFITLAVSLLDSMPEQDAVAALSRCPTIRRAWRWLRTCSAGRPSPRSRTSPTRGSQQRRGQSRRSSSPNCVGLARDL